MKNKLKQAKDKFLSFMRSDAGVEITTAVVGYAAMHLFAKCMFSTFHDTLIVVQECGEAAEEALNANSTESKTQTTTPEETNGQQS